MRISVLLIVTAAWGTAAEAGPIDDRLSAAQPCRDLPQISETEAVRLERATIELLPDTAEMTLVARIACRSAPDALLAADASVRIEATANLALEGCRVTSSEVALSEFAGSVGPLVEAFAADLEEDLAGDVAEAAEGACRDLVEN